MTNIREEDMKNTIIQIAKALNEKDIYWGIGGSLVLKYHGIVMESNEHSNSR